MDNQPDLAGGGKLTISCWWRINQILLVEKKPDFARENQPYLAWENQPDLYGGKSTRYGWLRINQIWLVENKLDLAGGESSRSGMKESTGSG